MGAVYHFLSSALNSSLYTYRVPCQLQDSHLPPRYIGYTSYVTRHTVLGISRDGVSTPSRANSSICLPTYRCCPRTCSYHTKDAFRGSAIKITRHIAGSRTQNLPGEGLQVYHTRTNIGAVVPWRTRNTNSRNDQPENTHKHGENKHTLSSSSSSSSGVTKIARRPSRRKGALRPAIKVRMSSMRLLNPPTHAWNKRPTRTNA